MVEGKGLRDGARGRWGEEDEGEGVAKPQAFVEGGLESASAL
jgi:hypothetical protein